MYKIVVIIIRKIIGAMQRRNKLNNGAVSVFADKDNNI
jgi:hypothetical protein